jgi:hypothetical protein
MQNLTSFRQLHLWHHDSLSATNLSSEHKLSKGRAAENCKNRQYLLQLNIRSIRQKTSLTLLTIPRFATATPYLAAIWGTTNNTNAGRDSPRLLDRTLT